MKYEVEVVESRAVLCRYRVEADTASEARDKAEIGDTLIETVLRRDMGVLNREVVSSPIEKGE
jgi:hypothetical protein